MHDDFLALVKTELIAELQSSLKQIDHCLDQVTEEQFWHRTAEDMNSLGNLVLHLTGNIGQYIVSGLSGSPDTRNRPAEFAERGPLPSRELRAKLAEVVAAAEAVIRTQTEADWLRKRVVQGVERTGLYAALHSIAHLNGHAQEIVRMVRQLLGSAYRFRGPAATVSNLR